MSQLLVFRVDHVEWLLIHGSEGHTAHAVRGVYSQVKPSAISAYAAACCARIDRCNTRLWLNPKLL